MKVMFLTRALDYGGAERQLVILARGLHERGHAVAVVVFYAGGALEHELRDAGVRVISLDKQGRWDAFGFLARLVKTVRSERPEVAHGYLLLPNLITLLIKLLMPDVRAVWGIRDSALPAGRLDWLERLLCRIEQCLGRFADLIIANSSSGAQAAIARGLPGSRMQVIYNGIDTERFKPDLAARLRLRAEFGFSDHEKLIGLIARLDPVKGHSTFLRAAASLSRELADVRFICVGDGPAVYRARLADLSSELALSDRLIWVPARNDMAAVYNALDMVVSSSYTEGFSNVIGEAMSCGVPAVVTNVGDSALIVGPCGEAVAKEDAEKLKEAMARTLAQLDVARNSDWHARQRILDYFSVASLIHNTESALTHSGKL